MAPTAGPTRTSTRRRPRGRSAHHTRPAHNHPPHRLPAVRIPRQRRILHALPNLKPLRLLALNLRNGFVNVSGHNRKVRNYPWPGPCTPPAICSPVTVSAR